jgi:hypothetical protein
MNMKFSKTVLNSDEKLGRTCGPDKSLHASRRLAHTVQYYTAGRKLLDAKAHPEKHKNLLVRVGGYSAYFIDSPAGAAGRNSKTHIPRDFIKQISGGRTSLGSSLFHVDLLLGIFKSLACRDCPVKAAKMEREGIVNE